MAFVFPQIETDNSSREFQEQFLGYNHNIRINEAEFYDMKNMTGDYYPVLSPRKKRGIGEKLTNPQGIIIKDEMWIFDDGKIYKNFNEFHLIDSVSGTELIISDGEKTLISMGAYLLIFPDKYYINTKDYNDCGKLHCSAILYPDSEVSPSYSVDYSMCTLDGTDYIEIDYVCDVDPDTVLLTTSETIALNDGDLWLDTSKETVVLNKYNKDDKVWEKITFDSNLYIYTTPDFNRLVDRNANGLRQSGAITVSNKPNGLIWRDTSGSVTVLKKWSNSSNMWSSIATSYIKIKTIRTSGGREDWAKVFEVGDAVDISGCTTSDTTITEEIEALNTSHIIKAKGDDYIVVVGMLSKTTKQPDKADTAIEIKREVPDLDFVIEHNNRLWGCKYGTVDGKFVNEIYASKQGDPKNWSCYAGISTDSYAVSLGNDGPFTGAIVYGGYPMFFKENFIHKIYGTMPSNYQVISENIKGVQIGSHKSLCIVNGALLYKSNSGVCLYDGSLPVDISYQLGEEFYQNAVAGGIGKKYYISMEDALKNRHLFVYDTSSQLWHKEDNLNPLQFLTANNVLYYIDNDKKELCVVDGTRDNQVEDDFEWYAETGSIGYSYSDNKYVGRLLLRVQKPLTSEVRVYLKYDDNEQWELVSSLGGYGTKSYSFPVLPRRCDHFALKIEGKGECKIYSISKVIEIGSDS